MLTNSDIVKYQHIFRKAYEAAALEIQNTSAWDNLATLGTEIISDGAEEDYRWLGDMPEFAEWVGDVNPDDLAEYKYTIPNIAFTADARIRKFELEDDKMNIVMPRINSMPGGYLRKWGKLLHTLIVNGTSNLAFDGVAFFSDASGARVNDNLLAGTISAGTPTIAQVSADVNTVRKAMLAFKNNKGEIVGVVPDTFVIPPNLELLFEQLMVSTADPNSSNAGAANPYSKYIKRVIVDPGLTDANDFYAFATQYSIGPFVRQKRKDVETALDDSHMNINGTLQFHAEFRGNVGYGLPILAAKVVSAVA